MGETGQDMREIELQRGCWATED